MLSFSEIEIDPAVLEEAARIADVFVSDTTRARELLIGLISSTSSERLLGTLSSAGAWLFMYVGSDDPDDTAASIAARFAEVVNTLWENQEGRPQRAAVEFTALLVASDFAPENPAAAAQVDSVGPVRIIVALAQWVIALSATVALVQDGTPTAGDPLRWAGLGVRDARDMHRVAIARGAR
jgi:hypothetical protein